MTVLAFIRPETARTILLVLVGGGYLAYHLIGWWRRRRLKVEGRRLKVRGQRSDKGIIPLFNLQPSTSSLRSEGEGQRSDKGIIPLFNLQPSTSSLRSVVRDQRPEDSGVGEGEELYVQARSIPHAPIPDPYCDRDYLRILRMAADRDYGPALNKFGEYAMRRAAWVEAYYWMHRARHQGVTKADAALRQIRTEWTMLGFPDELLNVSEFFSEEEGSIGRALLGIDSGRGASNARKFLQECHPEFL